MKPSKSEKSLFRKKLTRSRLVPGCDRFTWDAPRGAAVTTRNCGFGELRMFGVIRLGVIVTADCGWGM